MKVHPHRARQERARKWPNPRSTFLGSLLLALNRGAGRCAGVRAEFSARAAATWRARICAPATALRRPRDLLGCPPVDTHCADTHCVGAHGRSKLPRPRRSRSCGLPGIAELEGSDVKLRAKGVNGIPSEDAVVPVHLDLTPSAALRTVSRSVITEIMGQRPRQRGQSKMSPANTLFKRSAQRLVHRPVGCSSGHSELPAAVASASAAEGSYWCPTRRAP
ncbi:MAG: hypothetical protein ACJA2W_001047 [Planctomycetota bacterium]|jgi:hypothetical protein